MEKMTMLKTDGTLLKNLAMLVGSGACSTSER